MSTEQQRKQLISQIPDEQGRTAPAAKRLGVMSGSDLGRNVSNTVMALPGAGGAGRALGSIPAASRLMSSGVAGALTIGGALKGVGPYAVPAATLGGISMASQSPERGPTYQASPPAALPSAAPPQGQTAQTASAPTVTAAASLPNAQAGQIQYDAATKTYSGTDVDAGAAIVNGRGGGTVSAQNEQAANALGATEEFNSVARLATSGNVPAVPQRGMLAAPSVAHSGNDYSARKRLENMKASASSITNTARWGGKNAHLNPSVTAYQQALQADLAAQGKQPVLEMQTTGLNAGLMREQMSQDGANQRAAIGERNAAQRLGLDARRLGMEETAQGFQTRQAERMEAAQNDYVNAETDEARNGAYKRLVALSGKEPSGGYKLHVTPQMKNMDGSTTMGSVFRLNERTGDVQQVDGGNAMPPGMVKMVGTSNGVPVYEDASGKRFTAGQAAR